MVTLTSAASAAVSTTSAERRSELAWSTAAAAVLLLGSGLRLALGGGGIGDRSAAIMSALLVIGAWAAARQLRGPRAAFVAALVLVALFDAAALPTRGTPEYDDLQALYRPEQEIAVQLAVPPSVATTNDPSLSVLVQPVYSGVQPAFGLAGQVNGSALAWRCAFQRGAVQRLELPISADVLRGTSTADVRLHLTGSPTREADYLIVYASARGGGPLISLQPLANPAPSATPCTRE